MVALLTWTVTSGYIGHQVKCRGVAAALGGTVIEKTVDPPAPWRWLAPWGPAAADPAIAPPWPDVLIASSRQAIPYALMVRRRSLGRTITVALDDPGVGPTRLDLVWTTEHDRLRGPNVLVTPTAPHPHTREALASAAVRLSGRMSALGVDGPLVGVLVGGGSGAYSFSEADAVALGRALTNLAKTTGARLAVTPSRRTGERQTAALRTALADARCWFWDGTGENPYQGILGLADHIVATCDSVNMIGEAAFTGKPLQIWRLPGGSPKFERFHGRMAALGALRTFDGTLAPMSYEPLNATATIAAEVRRLILGRHGKG